MLLIHLKEIFHRYIYFSRVNLNIFFLKVLNFKFLKKKKTEVK